MNDCDTINVSGGMVYAAGGRNRMYSQQDSIYYPCDIGAGMFSYSKADITSVTISGTAAVFLKQDSYKSANLLDYHSHRTPTSLYDPLVFYETHVYDLVVPLSWTDAKGIFYIFYPSVPQTGDASSPMLYTSIAVLSMLGLLFIIRKNRTTK